MSRGHRTVQSYQYPNERKISDLQRDAQILNIAINPTKLDFSHLVRADNSGRKKYTSKSQPKKRSLSNGRATPDLQNPLSISSRMQNVVQNSKVWPFQKERHNSIENTDKKQVTGYGNLDMLLTHEKVNANMKKPSKLVLQPLSDRYEDMTWKKLPREFQKNPLFQAIYMKRKNEEKDLYTTMEMTNIENSPSFKPQLNIVQTSSGLKPLNPQVSSRRRMKTLPDAEPCYYAMSNIGYQNYAFRKLPSKKSIQYKIMNHRLADVKIPLEHFMNNIQSQQRILSKLEKDGPIETREILRREFNRSNVHKTTETYLDVVASGVKPEDEKYSLGANLINEVEPNQTLEDEVSSKGRVPLKMPKDYRINLNRSKSVVPEKKNQYQFDKSRKNSVPRITESRFLEKWKEEFEQLSFKSQKVLLEQREQRSQAADLDSSNSEMHFINNALKEPGISLKSFVESQRVLKNQKKFIVDRILLSLGANPSNDLSMMTWDKFLLFKQILVSKEAPVADLINFMIQFFKVDEGEELTRDKFILILRSMNEKVDSHRKIVDLLNSSYHVLLENFRIFGILKEGYRYVDFNAFRDVFSKNKMNILDLIDLISSVN